MKNKLVTLIGGGGFLGRYIAQALLAAGARVRIAQRDPRQAFFLKPQGGLGQTQFVAVDVTSEAAVQALAALRAGMHVVFTGPPGAGKTQLASRLCKAASFDPLVVTATDSWTTFETIGGYFPQFDGDRERLDFEPGVVVDKVRSLPEGTGLNAATGEYEDLMAAGINDPVKVTRSALQNAASIAGLFLTTEAVVANKPEPASAAAPAADPMGGMM